MFCWLSQPRRVILPITNFTHLQAHRLCPPIAGAAPGRGVAGAPQRRSSCAAGSLAAPMLPSARRKAPVPAGLARQRVLPTTSKPRIANTALGRGMGWLAAGAAAGAAGAEPRFAPGLRGSHRLPPPSALHRQRGRLSFVVAFMRIPPQRALVDRGLTVSLSTACSMAWRIGLRRLVESPGTAESAAAAKRLPPRWRSPPPLAQVDGLCCWWSPRCPSRTYTYKPLPRQGPPPSLNSWRLSTGTVCPAGRKSTPGGGAESPASCSAALTRTAPAPR